MGSAAAAVASAGSFSTGKNHAAGEVKKRREKLRFLTRESMHMKNLLSKYGEVVLQQVVKRMKEREARMRQQEEDDDDDD